MTPVSWTPEDLKGLCKRISSLEAFFIRNQLTILYDTNPEDPHRDELVRNISGLHRILESIISIEERLKQQRASN